jgi:uncharacterized protein YbaR (Trm112 family)/SAM-dependent methyltransferase
MPSVSDKLAHILACPTCKTPIALTESHLTCNRCGVTYHYISGVPCLIDTQSPVFEWYAPELPKPQRNGFKAFLWKCYQLLKPSERVWTRRSLNVIQEMLEEKNPDSASHNVVLIGAGFEPPYRRLLKPYQHIHRVGLAHRGETNVCCDICDIPLTSNSADLVFSSSIIEHVYNPERAVAEMFRILKPGGLVYTEIPFMRAYHMIPVDYQRYTISGIQQLFSRHGFSLVDKGICSGPFTGFVLFIIDFFTGLLQFNSTLSAIVILGLAILLHPIKYLDRLFEDSGWAEISACNFYYLGRK